MRSVDNRGNCREERVGHNKYAIANEENNVYRDSLFEWRSVEADVTEDWKQDRIGAAERGENPTVIARMPGGYAVMGDRSFCLDIACCLRRRR